MTTETEIRSYPPQSLTGARAMTHRAVQLATRAARANLPVCADDSHSSLLWDAENQCMVTALMDGKSDKYRVAIALPKVGRAGLELHLERVGQETDHYTLDGMSQDEALTWLDGHLAGAGLNPAAPINVPYPLPPEVTGISIFQSDAAALRALAAWYDLALNILSDVSRRHNGISPGAGPISVWPHHFDIATYVRLSDSLDETAPGIGMGMSPGDESYGQPYFYVNPWPRPDPQRLASAPTPGHWHTVGFVGAIASADELLTTPDATASTLNFVNTAFDIAHDLLTG